MQSATPTQFQWFFTDNLCALSDSERHLAHVVKLQNQWFAFDATHSNNRGDGFAFLGSFARRQAALQAVESVTLRMSGTAVSAGATSGNRGAHNAGASIEHGGSRHHAPRLM